MKLKVQLIGNDETVAVKTVEVPRLDVQVAVKKAALSVNMAMSDVREARILAE